MVMIIRIPILEESKFWRQPVFTQQSFDQQVNIGRSPHFKSRTKEPTFTEKISNVRVSA